jgi:hypothetical protein
MGLRRQRRLPKIAELGCVRRAIVIVVDHHEREGSQLPKSVCVGLIRSSRDSVPVILCTVGLAFKVAHAFAQAAHFAGDWNLRDLPGLGRPPPPWVLSRILVPRTWVRTGPWWKRGLLQLGNSRWSGIRAHPSRQSGMGPPFTHLGTVGLGLGPRFECGRAGWGQRANALEL